MAPALAAIDALLPMADRKAPALASGSIAALAVLSRVAGWRLAPGAISEGHHGHSRQRW